MILAAEKFLAFDSNWCLTYPPLLPNVILINFVDEFLHIG